MSSISRWLCKTSTKNLFVKIVHPGGHVELHDRPILASELLNRNPRCCVAYPNVFQQPYAVVAPEAILTLGRKYYVVPLGTIRKLQLKHPRPPEQQEQYIQENDEGSSSSSWCWMSEREKSEDRERDKNSGCFQSMSSTIKIKSKSNEDLSDETIRTKGKRNRGNNTGSLIVEASVKRLPLVSCDNWQPRLQSMVEEY